MLDLKFVRENPEIVKQNIKNKFQDQKLPLVDEVIALDVENRKAQQEADALRSNRKTISKQIGALMAQGKREEAEEEELREKVDEFNSRRLNFENEDIVSPKELSHYVDQIKVDKDNTDINEEDSSKEKYDEYDE